MASINQLLKRKQVDEIVSDEPGEYYVYLAYGYQVDGQGNDVEGCHGFGTDSVNEIATTLRDQVIPCKCSSCK